MVIIKNKNLIIIGKTVLICIVAILTGSGCGYHVGTMMHPQIKTVAIAPIKNETMEPLVTQLMRKQLAQQFQVDGSLRLKSLETADCIVYARILQVRTTESAEDSTNADMTYRTAQWALEIKLEFVVIIPGRRKPLVHRSTVIGKASFDVTNDQNTARRSGLDAACLSVAKKVVANTTEAW